MKTMDEFERWWIEERGPGGALRDASPLVCARAAYVMGRADGAEAILETDGGGLPPEWRD